MFDRGDISSITRKNKKHIWASDRAGRHLHLFVTSTYFSVAAKSIKTQGKKSVCVNKPKKDFPFHPGSVVCVSSSTSGLLPEALEFESSV